MKWTVEVSTWSSGLYDVYDEDGNRIIEHTILENANLMASTPELLEALKRTEQTLRNLADHIFGTDLALIANNEAANVREILAKVEE